MNKLKTSCKELPKKKKIYKIPDPALAYPLSYTPSIKILSQANTGRSTVPTRDSQSHASSPHIAREDFRFFQSSPFPKDSIKIETLLKHSVKHFKRQKLELAKIKEFAEKWKKTRKKKIQDFNQLTRIENKAKSTSKSSRARTAWESPEHRDRPSETLQLPSKQTNSTERRANIGLEFYNLKSPRNTTPKNLQKTKNIVKKNLIEVQSKKKITDFIKKKRKQRQKEEKKIRENEEENELKRLAQLIKVERAAKEILKKKKRKVEKIGKNKENKENLKKNKNFAKVFNELEVFDDVKKFSVCFSEDEEVQNIMQVRKLTENIDEVNSGRQCLIFAEASESMSLGKVDVKDVVDEIVKGRVGSEDFSFVIRTNMPIVELKSVSNESDSGLSEKMRRQMMEKMKQKEKFPEILGKPEKNPLDFIKPLQKIINKQRKQIFLSIKSYSTYKPPSPSELLKNSLTSPQNHREELNEVLNKYLQSRETSEDFEKIRKNFETHKKIEIIDKLENSSRTSKSGPNPEQDSKCLIQTTSKKISSTKTKDQDVDSSSLLSIISDSSEIQDELLIFLNINQPLNEVDLEPEPNRPYFLNQDLIFVEEGNSINEDFQRPKESSFVVFLENEDFFNFDEFKTENVLESNLKPNDDKVIEKTIHDLIEFIYLECVCIEVFNEYKSKNYKLLGNSAVIMEEACVFTSEFGIKQTSLEIFSSLDEDLLKSAIFDRDFHLFNLGNFNEKLKESEKIIKKSQILYENPYVGFGKIHNKCIFDLIDSFLVLHRKQVNHPAWKLGKINEKIWDFNKIIKKFIKWAERFCRVCSGKIPTTDMVLSDGTLDEDLLQSIREQGLERILFFDIIEAESLWTDYEMQENLLMLDVADLIVSDLIEETEGLLKSSLLVHKYFNSVIE